jgi:hypothetical protein
MDEDPTIMNITLKGSEEKIECVTKQSTLQYKTSPTPFQMLKEK